jgi:hypothetical protein
MAYRTTGDIIIYSLITTKVAIRKKSLRFLWRQIQKFEMLLVLVQLFLLWCLMVLEEGR